MQPALCGSTIRRVLLAEPEATVVDQTFGDERTSGQHGLHNECSLFLTVAPLMPCGRCVGGECTNGSERLVRNKPTTFLASPECKNCASEDDGETTF